MERPTKRQKLSQEPALAIPSRTINLESFQRSYNRRRNGGKVILPRVPDVTVTASVLDVSVNGGGSATQIAAPTTDVAITYSGLGTVTIPAVTSSSDSGTTSQTSSSLPSDTSKSDTGSISISTSQSTLAGITSTFINRNSTTLASTSGNTVTVTATSTLLISYEHGSFIPITVTPKSRPTDSYSSDDSDSNSGSSESSSSFNFNQLDTTSTTGATAATGVVSPGYNNAAIGATGTDTATQPTSSSGNDSGSSPPVLTPQQTRVVSGVVGGIAGVAMVLIILLYVLRWYRARLKGQGRLPHQLVSSHNSRDFGVSGLMSCAAPMSQSRTALFPVAASASMKKWRPGSDMTAITNATSTTSDSERGFHRVSGRKIPSVLSTGGDQFGGSYGAFEKEVGASVIKSPAFNQNHNTHNYSQAYTSDAESTYGYTPPHRPSSRSAPSTPHFPVAFAGEAAIPAATRLLRSGSSPSSRPFGLDEFQKALGRNTTKPDGMAVFHSSPARTPVMQSPNTSTLRIPNHASVTMDADIPEMPLPSPGLNAEFQRYNQSIGVAIGTGVGGGRMASGRLSARSGAGSGRFKEDLD